MAKVNPVKLKQEAEKLEKAGRPDQAIALYRQIVDDNPRDWNVINKIGDLYAKLNRSKEAADEYAKVADFYAKDGFLLKAIAIWKKINKLDASALEPYQQLADLYAKQGLMMEAKAQYQIVIDEFIKRGRTRDAGEALRKMAEIDPGDLKVRSKLADLYTREGSADKAVGEHIAIAEELNKKGHLAEALQVLEKGLKLDPRSDRLRLELARIHLIQKNYEKAAQYLEEAVQRSHSDPVLLARLGEAYLGGRKIEEAEAIFKRLLEINPGDDEARAQMGRVYLQQGRFDDAFTELQPAVERLLARRDSDKAVALLQQVTQRNPQHVKTLVKLAEIHRASQKDSLLRATLSQLTEALLAQNDFERAAEALEELVQREPQHQQHRTKLEFVRGKLKGGRPRARPAPPAAVEFEEEFDARGRRGAAPRAAPAAAPPPPPAPSRIALEPTGPLSEEDREFIEEHVAEGRVFRKYGLVGKAVDQFEAVVARFPDNLEARQELREAYKDDGKPQKAAEQCLALAEIFRLKGDETSARAQEEEARRLAPGAAPPVAAAPPAAPPAVVSSPPPKVAAPAAIGLEEEEEQAEEEVPLAAEATEAPLTLEEDEEIALEVEEPHAPAARAAAPPPAAARAEPPLLEIDIEGGEEELPVQFVDEEPLAVIDEAEEELVDVEPEAAPEAATDAELGLSEEELVLPEAEELEPERAAAPPAEPLAEAVASEYEPAAEDAAIELEEEEVSFEEEPAPPAPKWAPPPARVAPPPAPPAPTAARAAAAAPPALARVLDEVDQYMALGFVDDARDALRELVARHPNHPAIEAKLDELGMELDVEEPPAAPPAELADELLGADVEAAGAAAPAEEEPVEEPFVTEEEAPEPAFSDLSLAADFEPDVVAEPGPAGIDLAAELDDLFAAQPAVAEPAPEAVSSELGDSGLAEIFKEFKKGVDKQLGQEDYDTRYNLGIAYKEMGLVDEAIAEFQLAAKDERRLLECASMLGICFLDKGMPKLAIKWFEKGLRAPGRKDEEYLGLRYDLAMAHEAAGDVTTALTIFTDLYGQDATFRDVAAKVRELRAQA